jgi:plasmid stability protein
MPTMTIRDVPDETVAALTAKAARTGLTLQAHLLDLLDRDARTETLAMTIADAGPDGQPAT